MRHRSPRPAENVETLRVETEQPDLDTAALQDLRMRLDSVLAVGLFTTMEGYLMHCRQVDVTAGWIAGELRYGLGSPAQRTYRAAMVGQIYTATHIEGLAAEIGILRRATPVEWGDLPLYELVQLTDTALAKAAQRRESQQMNRTANRSETPVLDHYKASLSAPSRTAP